MTSKTDLRASTSERKGVTSSLMRHLSLKHKVIATIMLTCVLALSLVGGVLFTWERTILRRTIVRDLSVHAQVLAANCKAALAFGDRADAMQILQAADAVAPIVVACVYTADGGLFAAYSREGTAAAVPPAGQLEDHPVFEKGFLVLTKPVLLDGEKIGVVCLKASLDFMRKRLEQEALAIFGVLLLSSLFAWLISSKLQHIISHPILRLADVARFVAENKQYTIRAEANGSDEVGLLIQTFNEMLEQIQQRDAALTEANEHLEARVRERTAELSSANAKLAYLASFPERNPGPVMEVDLDGNLRYANPATLRLFPDLHERGAAHPWLADWPTVAALFQDGQTDTTVRDVTVGGRSYEQLLHYFAQDRFVRIYGTDITERKRAEEALQESEARFRLLVEQAGDGFELLDAEGRYVDANSTTCKRLGYSKDELLRLTIQDTDSLVSAEAYAARFRSLAGRPPTTFESVHRCKDGTTFPVEVTTSIIQLGGVPLSLALVRDVTERKQAEDAIRQQKDLLGSILSNIPYYVFWKDRNCVYLGCNEVFARGAGVGSPENIVGRTDYDLIWKNEADFYRRCDRQVMESGNPILHMEEPQTREDGRQITLLTSKVPLRDASGNVVGVLGIYTDITKHKQAERQQARLLQQLAEINQELADFAYVVSHDLKAPLRAIRTLADWLCADYQDKLDEQGKENFQLLSNRVDRMQNLIDGVLQYSRIGRTEQEKAPVDLRQLVPQIVESLGVPEHISVHIGSGLPTVEADVTRITQVFQNLLSNAIKYMDKPQGSITVACVQEGPFWKFSISDNGPGIEEKHFERIFKLFQTLAPRDGRESTGVGLTIVKKIVEMYGGEVWVESQVGQGSTFLFTLPKFQTEVNGVEHETATA